MVHERTPSQRYNRSQYSEYSVIRTDVIGLSTMSTQSRKSCLPNLKPLFLLASVRVCEGRRFRTEIRSERQDDDGRLECRNTTTKRTISPQTLWSIERSGTVNLTRFAPRWAQNGGAVGFLAQLQKTGFCTHCPLFLQRAGICYQDSLMLCSLLSEREVD